MPEPVITPLAAFGLSMTLLNFFISTIQNLHEKYHEIKDYQQMLDDLGRDVFVCASSYELWINLWGRSNEQAYKAFFGIDWPLIENAKQRIENLARQTAKLLCLETTLPLSLGKEPKASTASTIPGDPEPPTPDQTSTTPALALSTTTLWIPRPLRDRLIRRNSKAKEAASDGPIELEADERGEWGSFTKSLIDALSKQPDHAMIELTAKSSEGAKRFWNDLKKHSRRPEKLMRCILGILGRNKYLKTSVSDLEKALKSLTELTKNAIEKMGHGSVPTQLHEVRALNDAIVFREIAQTLKDVVQRQNVDGTGNSKWFIELKFPDHLSSEPATKEILTRCNFSFVVIPVTPKMFNWRKEVEITRLRDRDRREAEAKGATTSAMDVESAVKEFQGSDIHIRFNDAIFKLETVESCPTFVTENWRTLLTKCSEETNVRKYLELARARFALGLAFWMISFWETDWFTHVCSCAFRCVLFLPTDRASELKRQDEDENEAGDLTETQDKYRQEHIYASMHPEETAPASCRGNTNLNDRLYHFGILLSELILAHPIRLTSDLDHQPRIAQGRPTGLFTESRGILKKISARKVKNAIDFCFTDTVEWTDKNHKYTTARLELFIQNVLEPLIEYHNVVKKNFKPHYSKEFVRCMEEFWDKAYDQCGDANKNLTENGLEGLTEL